MKRTLIFGGVFVCLLVLAVGGWAVQAARRTAVPLARRRVLLPASAT